MKGKKEFSPYTIISTSFLLMIFIGGTLLSLPVVTIDGKGTDWITGLFTATSAVCVTGLSVNDISTTYNMYGKIVIIILIQLGALGLITFSSLFVLLVSKKISYFTKKVVQEDLNVETVLDIQNYIKKVVATVFGIEFAGAFFLFFEFIRKFEFKKALFYSLFHSVSAFCNAGFSLFSDNLASFKGSIIINLIIPFLIITGGIGFGTLLNIYRYFTGKDRRLTITSKMTVIISLILVIIGTVLIFLIEYSNIYTMGNFTFPEKIGAAFFQSVSTRTAGFNTVSLSGLKETTVFIFMILMFIGASPGSTGGGIKTTTLGLIILGIKSTIENKEDLEIYKRRISWNNFNRAMAIVCISISYIGIIFLLLTITEKNINSTDLLFELVSAFGTAGLSRDVTPLLGNTSRILIMLTMFIGRIGPLTITLSLLKKKLKKGKHKYPMENILVG